MPRRRSWCRGRALGLVLHLVRDHAPVVELADGTLARFALCGLSTDPWPPPQDDRGTPLCVECRRRAHFSGAKHRTLAT